MLTGISAFYGIGPQQILLMPVGLRRRYYEQIPVHQAERNLNLAGVVLLPHAGESGRAAIQYWQSLVARAKSDTRRGIEALKNLIRRYAEDSGQTIRDPEA